MKKLFVQLIAVILTIVLFCTCDKNEVFESNAQSDLQMQALTSDITTYIMNFEEQTPTRNGWNWVNAGFADYGGWMVGRRLGFWGGMYLGGFGGAAAGYFVGGIAGAGIASAAALLSSDSVVLTGDILYNLDNKFDDFGESHNIYVMEILQRKNEFMINGVLDKEKFLVIVKSIALEMNYDEMVNFDSVHLDVLLSETENLSFDEGCVTTFFDNLIVEYPDEAAIIQLQKQYTLKAISLNSVVDLSEFSKGYEIIVEKAQICEKDKENLLTSSSLLKNSLVAYTIEE